MIARRFQQYWKFRSSREIQQRDLRSLIETIAFEPQAIINEDVGELARRSDWRVVSGHDDLDEFTGIGLQLADLPVAVMHYRGHPNHTSTIYLPFGLNDPEEIGTAVQCVLEALRVPRERLKWQRSDNPDL